MDAYVAIEQNRLKYLRLNKKELRADLYQGLQDTIAEGDNSIAAIGQRIILPSSFTVGPRHMVQNHQDAMVIYKWAHCPAVFVTFIYNPQWPEIKRALLLGQEPRDRPYLITQVFKIKLKELINDIHKKHILGHTIAGIYVIEFQKCGLPHAHILILFAENYKPHTVKDVDRMINVKLLNPETNRLAHKMVARCMMHDAWSMWSCVSKCPMHGRRQMQKTISTQVPIRDDDGCKRISYLSTHRYMAHTFGSWR